MKKDVFYNLLAVSLPVAALQLVVLPAMNSCMALDAYGLAIALMAVLNVFPVAVGNSLCNVRQLMEGEYRDRGLSGDFLLLNVCFAAVSNAIVVIASFSMGANLGECAGLVVASLFMQFYNYGIVFYRLTVDFKRVFFTGLALSAGYIVGYSVFSISLYWPVVLIVGYLIPSIYIIARSNILSDGFCKTKLFDRTTRIQVSLLGSLLLANAANYGDRLILFPLLGASAVSVYYISSLVGKILVMMISPMSTVLLTYLAKSAELDKGKTKRLLRISLLSGAFFWIAACVASPAILGFLYPQEATAAVEYVPFAAAVAVFQAACSVLNPTLLRFFDVKWQVISNALSLTLMVGFGFVLSHAFSLLGFCIACLIASVAKFVFVAILVLKGERDAEYRVL